MVNGKFDGHVKYISFMLEKLEGKQKKGRQTALKSEVIRCKDMFPPRNINNS